MRRIVNMNIRLNDSSQRAAQLKSLLVALEDSLAKVEPLSDSLVYMDNAMNLLYLSIDVADSVVKDLEKLQTDERAANAHTPLREI
jgi:hypothetical protein